jgi:hypothetical protein
MGTQLVGRQQGRWCGLIAVDITCFDAETLTLSASSDFYTISTRALPVAAEAGLSSAFEVILHFAAGIRSLRCGHFRPVIESSAAMVNFGRLRFPGHWVRGRRLQIDGDFYRVTGRISIGRLVSNSYNKAIWNCPASRCYMPDLMYRRNNILRRFHRMRL